MILLHDIEDRDESKWAFKEFKDDFYSAFPTLAERIAVITQQLTAYERALQRSSVPYNSWDLGSTNTTWVYTSNTDISNDIASFSIELGEENGS